MPSSTFSARARDLHREIQASGLTVFDMRGEPHLELRLAGQAGVDAEAPVRDPAPVMWLESPDIFARPVIASRDRSPVRYFLDGAQRTLPGYHCAAAPIVAAVSAAAILERQSPSEMRVLPGTLVASRAWLVPERTGATEILEFATQARSVGEEVADPLVNLEPGELRRALGDFARLEDLAFSAARDRRAHLERTLLEAWPACRQDDEWLIVDGPLRLMAAGAIGLVKSFSRQYLWGEHAAMLFDLPAGHRTPAFTIEDGWRLGTFTGWYLRLWNAAGRDPRHALVRVEVTGAEFDSARIDEVSTWIMAERTPRATADARWPTLLYPMHYLERVLKRYVDSQTRAWPGPLN